MKSRFEAIRTGVNDLDKAEAIEPKGHDVCTCPKCDTYNEIIKKRRNTIAVDIVYCWHCGQALLVKHIKN